MHYPHLMFYPNCVFDKNSIIWNDLHNMEWSFIEQAFSKDMLIRLYLTYSYGGHFISNIIFFPFNLHYLPLAIREMQTKTKISSNSSQNGNFQEY